MDYRNYVSFRSTKEIRALMRESGEDFDEFRVPDDLRADIERAMAEIASTPEGADLIQRAAARGPDGKINIFHVDRDDATTMAFRPNDILFNERDRSQSYFSENTGRYQDMSLQSILVHEMNHIALGHKELTPENENEAVAATNAYMKKYYGEPERVVSQEDTIQSQKLGRNVDNINRNGTEWFDYNDNFDPDGGTPKANLFLSADSARMSIGRIDPDTIKNLSPETQALYEFRRHPDKFQEQYDAMKDNGSLEHVDNDMIELLDVEEKQMHPLASPQQTVRPTINGPAP